VRLVFISVCACVCTCFFLRFCATV
jgi:hypothetical protein